MANIKGKTQSGFSFSVSETIGDNMELIDALADLDSGNALAISKVCQLVLGDEQRKKLYDHLRREDGTVPTAEVEKDLMDVINALGKKGKNSPSSPA